MRAFGEARKSAAILRSMTTAREQTARLADLLRREHHAMADFLLALADFDAKRAWLDLGYSGLFPFLNRELGLSKAASYFRKTAAGLVRRFPEIVEPLRDGRLCLTAVVELSRVITPENRADVLPRFFHCSKREAKAVSAALAPQEAPPRRETITAVARRAVPRHENIPPVAARLDETESQPVRPGEPRSPETLSLAPPAPPPCAPTKRDEAEPLTADLSRLHVTVSRRFLEKLEAARAALSHSHRGATIEQILEAGLDLVLAQHAKHKGLVDRPRKVPPPSKPEHVPAHVRRAVWIRDGGRCQFPLQGGGICGSTWRVEYDHIQPRALGGQSTIENGRLACDVHNDFSARLIFGDDWMNQFTTKGKARQHDAVPLAP
jgi:5-methylcytosine-specific restriction endonuclease McrA